MRGANGMDEPFFFDLTFAVSPDAVAAVTGAHVVRAPKRVTALTGFAPLERAGARDIVFYENPRYAAALARTGAGACLLRERDVAHAPADIALLVTPHPAAAFARLLAHLVPAAARPSPMFGEGVSSGAHIHPLAQLEPGVHVDPGAVIGPRAEIGTGTVVGAHVVVGAGVRIGRDCAIGAGAAVSHALVGDRVIIHPGARIGQDGFGFAQGPQRVVKTPQIGRVIIQDDVEIGANTTIDRGACRDTMIGEGAKIDNLVQIAHNVIVGRFCMIAAQVGVAGSARLGDYVKVGGQTGVAGHLVIGRGAEIAAQSGVMRPVAPGDRVAGSPARPLRDFLKAAARERARRKESQT